MAIISVGRTHTFDPKSSIGGRFVNSVIVWENPKSLALSEVNLTQLRLETMLRPGERTIKSEVRRKRLERKGFVLLNAEHFQFFWENPHLIPEGWKERRETGLITHIRFEGTIFEIAGVQEEEQWRHVLDLWYGNDKKWHFDAAWFDNRVGESFPSAVVFM